MAETVKKGKIKGKNRVRPGEVGGGIGGVIDGVGENPTAVAGAGRRVETDRQKEERGDIPKIARGSHCGEMREIGRQQI